MPKSIKIYEHGGPEVLKWEDTDVGHPEKGEVRIRQTVSGLNFIDCYQRSGLYPMKLPTILGSEGVGIIEEVGEGVTSLIPGQRVAYAGGQSGSYAEERIIAANALIPLPQNIDDQSAAAILLKGLTAHMLLYKCHAVASGDTILVHAAAGGVGSIMCQWANQMGATVIGTVGSEEKAEKARANGCSHPINYNKSNFVEQVKEITEGKGVPVVYDSVGKSTFDQSMDCLENFGTLVSYGNASGPAPSVEPLTLMQKGSIVLTRPTLLHYAANTEQRDQAADSLFDVVSSGGVNIEIGQTFPLKEAAEAHAALESRNTTGSTVLLID